jgi:CMP/dCMP kinase
MGRSDKGMIIAIDGPAGAGKSTVCRLLAEKLEYVYLDTGAMYRATAWALRREGFDFEGQPPKAAHLSRLPLRFAVQRGALVIHYAGKILEDELRQPEMSQLASLVSKLETVRTFLTLHQRALASESGIVAEGRDMATVVFPNAALKVYLTADLPTRAERRQAEYAEKGIAIEYSVIEAEVRERDEADKRRCIAPLRLADDAVRLDTSRMDVPQVVERLLKLVSEKAKEESGPDAAGRDHP